MTKTHCKTLTLTGVLALSMINVTIAGECNRSDIDHYLDKGFTLPEIMQLCTTKGMTAGVPGSAAKSPGNPPSNLLVFLETALDAEKVEVTPDSLIIRQERCFPYGEEGFTGIRPSACLKRKISIQRKGLKIDKVVEKRSIFRDGKLIVLGKIEQSFNKLNTLKKRAQKAFLKKYPPHLQSFDIPVKDSMKRQDVADAIEQLIK